MHLTLVLTRHLLFLLCSLVVAAAFAQPLSVQSRGVTLAREAQAARILESLRGQHATLAVWLRQMPKGADLHSHLSGAVYAESYLRWAAEDGLCVDASRGSITPGPECAAPSMPARELNVHDKTYEQMLRSLSMRDFRGFDSQGPVAGHMHFFGAFGRYGAATSRRTADMVAEVAERAAANGVQYLELMLSPGMREAANGAPLLEGSDWASVWTADRARLQAIAADASKQMDMTLARTRQLLACDDAQRARPGCRVEVRFLSQVTRVLPLHQVFAQASLGFELAQRDKRFAGINLVAPEHDPVALRDYEQQMRLIGWLKARVPEVAVSLHAGELVWGLVPPEQMRSHIRQAVDIAGARRIGHGVSIAHEDDTVALLQRMARIGVAVEINLTSNDLILGVKGTRHPMHLYLRHGVPLVLSTDDEGISRIDITHEYLRAMTEHGIGYQELKRMARHSLMHAFVDGESLWLPPSVPRGPLRLTPACERSASPECTTLPQRSPRARLQWAQEQAFERFESELIRAHASRR